MAIQDLTKAEKVALASRHIEQYRDFPKNEGENNGQHVNRFLNAELLAEKARIAKEIVTTQYYIENPNQEADVSDVVD